MRMRPVGWVCEQHCNTCRIVGPFGGKLHSRSGCPCSLICSSCPRGVIRISLICCITYDNFF